MRPLLWTQSCYYYAMIKKRFWLLTWAYLIIVVGYFGRLPRRENLLTTILTGPDFSAIKQGYPYLPPFWLMIMILPIFIMGDSFRQIQVELFSKARGLGFSKQEFGLNNLMLIAGTNLCYLGTILMALMTFEVMTGGLNIVKNGLLASYLNWGLRLVLILMLLSLIQQICGWLHRALMMLVPIAGLIYTDFTITTWNPLNLVLWPRTITVSDTISVAIVSCLVLVTCYIYLYGKYELK